MGRGKEGNRLDVEICSHMANALSVGTGIGSESGVGASEVRVSI